MVIPAFNNAGTIKTTLQSVLNQSLSANEIIVVDDASQDTTSEAAGSAGPNIQVIRQTENAGPGAARNTGVHHSTGELIAFLDADDHWHPNHLQCCCELLQNHPTAGLAFTAVQLSGQQTGIWPNNVICDHDPKNVFLDLFRHNFIHLSSVVVRRNLFEAVNGFKDIVEFYRGRRVQAEDYDFTLRCALEMPFVASREASAVYQIHDEQSSVFPTPQKIMSFIYRLRILELLRTDNKQELADQAAERMLRDWEECLRDSWAQKDTASLRQFIRFSRQHSILQPATKYYRVRQYTPSVGLKAYSLLRT